MTKAERIYRETRSACLQYVNDGFYQENEDGSTVGFTGLYCRDDEHVSIRTVNDVAKVLEREKRMLKVDVEFGILDADQAAHEEKVLRMIEATLNNDRKRIQRFNEDLKNG